jgi:hypothetical protein
MPNANDISPNTGDETTEPGGNAAPVKAKAAKAPKGEKPSTETAAAVVVEPFTVSQIKHPFLRRVAEYVAGSLESALSAQASSDLADLCVSAGLEGRQTATGYLFDRTLKQGFDDGRDDPIETPKTIADFWKKARQQNLVVLLTPVKKPRALVRWADKADWLKGFSWTAPSHPSVTPGSQSETTYEFRPGFVTPVEARHLLALFSSVPMCLVEVAPPVSLASNALIGSANGDPLAHVREHFIPRPDAAEATE